jgi:adenylate cyclase
MDIRGRHEACMVYRVEWQNEVPTDLFTVPASLSPSSFTKSVPQPGTITLSWLDVEASFTSAELPIHIGRDAEAQFVINDPRVSRLHVMISWRGGKFYIEDVSSYGTWVRFAENHAVIDLRRQECALLVEGEIALGAPFEDFTVPTVSFGFQAGSANKRNY